MNLTVSDNKMEYTCRGKRKDGMGYIAGNPLYDGLTGKYYIHPTGDCLNESELVNEEGCLRFMAYEVYEDSLCRCTGYLVKDRILYENDLLEICLDDDRIIVPVRYGEYADTSEKDRYHTGFYIDWDDYDSIYMHNGKKITDASIYVSMLRKELGFWLKERNVRILDKAEYPEGKEQKD